MDVAESTSTLLLMDGHEVVAVHDGRTAVHTARSFRPHLAILDISMPVLDGYAVARALRKDHTAEYRLVLVAHTALVLPANVEDARQAGFNYHLAKPVGGCLCDLIASYLLEDDDERDLQRCH